MHFCSTFENRSNNVCGMLQSNAHSPLFSNDSQDCTLPGIERGPPGSATIATTPRRGEILDATCLNGVQLPAVLFFSWSANDTGANYWRRHHLTNCWRRWERGELNSKNSIPNPTPECTSCAPTSNSRIGEVFGFKVTLLFGHWTRRERVETHRPKISNHWAMYSKLRRDKIGMQSLIFTSLFDCNGPSNQSMRLN